MPPSGTPPSTPPTPPTSLLHSIITIAKDLVSSSIFNGIITLLGLLIIIFGENLWIQLIAVVIAIAAAIRFVWLVQQRSHWFTGKFVIGLIGGVIIGIVLSYFFLESINDEISSLFFTHISIVDVTRDLKSSDGYVEVRLSQPIPKDYWKYVSVKIDPEYPIYIEWLSEFPRGIPCCRIIAINPNRTYSGEDNPRFEHGATYRLVISGPMFSQPQELSFTSP